MSDKSLDLSILSQTPSIVTDDHLALINYLLEKGQQEERGMGGMCKQHLLTVYISITFV